MSENSKWGRVRAAVGETLSERPLQTMVGLESFLFGLWLLLPIQTFTASPNFDVLEHWLPEEGWGALFLVVGTAQLLALFAARVRPVRLAYTAAAILWFALCVGFGFANPYSTALVTYPLFVLANLVISLQWAGGR